MPGSEQGASRPLFTRSELLRLIIPLVIEQLLLMTVGMADTVMVTTSGEAAVSGVSLVDNINTLIIHPALLVHIRRPITSSVFCRSYDTTHTCCRCERRYFRQRIRAPNFCRFIQVLYCEFAHHCSFLYMF